MDNRQISILNPDKAKVERWIFRISCFIWICTSLWFCTLGFGADTDAWLMAQTAQKLRLGLGYDPARSAGNPLYELLLALLQPGQIWWASNLFNFGIAVLILVRIPNYFSDFTLQKKWRNCLFIITLPVFWSSATSSMESILALWLWLETGLAVQRIKVGQTVLFTLFTTACRPEYFVLIIVQHWPFWRLHHRYAAMLSTMVLAYLFWVYGKNPLPFHDIESTFRFYAGRLVTLFRGGAGLLYCGVLLVAFYPLSSTLATEWRRAVFINVALFAVFPFEWTYLLPSLFISSFHLRINTLHLGIALVLSLVVWRGGAPGFEMPWQDRKWKTEAYSLAQTVDFPKNTLLLYGATWFPTDVTRWKKSMKNRLFHRTGSHFFVGEKLNHNLDSLHQAGFTIVVYGKELGEFRNAAGKPEIPYYILVINDLPHFLKTQNR